MLEESIAYHLYELQLQLLRIELCELFCRISLSWHVCGHVDSRSVVPTLCCKQVSTQWLAICVDISKSLGIRVSL
jgi:hypothetical protein